MKYQYYRPNILLVINPQGLIRQLYMPLRVLNNMTNAWVYVDEIQSNDRDELFFVVNNQALLHSLFTITIYF